MVLDPVYVQTVDHLQSGEFTNKQIPIPGIGVVSVTLVDKKYVVVRIDPDNPDEDPKVVSHPLSEDDAKRRLQAFNRLLDRGIAAEMWKEYPFVFTVTEVKT